MNGVTAAAVAIAVVVLVAVVTLFGWETFDDLEQRRPTPAELIEPAPTRSAGVTELTP